MTQASTNETWKTGGLGYTSGWTNSNEGDAEIITLINTKTEEAVSTYLSAGIADDSITLQKSSVPYIKKLTNLKNFYTADIASSISTSGSAGAVNLNRSGAYRTTLSVGSYFMMLNMTVTADNVGPTTSVKPMLRGITAANKFVTDTAPTISGYPNKQLLASGSTGFNICAILNVTAAETYAIGAYMENHGGGNITFTINNMYLTRLDDVSDLTKSKKFNYQLVESYGYLDVYPQLLLTDAQKTDLMSAGVAPRTVTMASLSTDLIKAGDVYTNLSKDPYYQDTAKWSLVGCTAAITGGEYHLTATNRSSFTVINVTNTDLYNLHLGDKLTIITQFRIDSLTNIAQADFRVQIVFNSVDNGNYVTLPGNLLVVGNTYTLVIDYTVAESITTITNAKVTTNFNNLKDSTGTIQASSNGMIVTMLKQFIIRSGSYPYTADKWVALLTDGTLASGASSDVLLKAYSSTTAEKVQTKWTGKKVVTYGDSTVAQGKWQPYLIEKLGVNIVNVGTSGAPIELMSTSDPNYSAATDADKNTKALCVDANLAAIPSDADLVIFMAGYNDVGFRLKSIPFSTGTVLEADLNLDKYNMQGALGYIIKRIFAIAPNTKLIIVSQPYAYDDRVKYVNFTNVRAPIKETAEFYAIPFVDTYDCWNYWNYMKYHDVQYDVHFNSAGGNEVANRIIKKMQELEPR